MLTLLSLAAVAMAQSSNTTYSTVFTHFVTTTVAGGNTSTFGLVVSEHDSVPVSSHHLTGNLTTGEFKTRTTVTTTHKGHTSTQTLDIGSYFTLVGNTTVGPVVAEHNKNAGVKDKVGVLLPVALAACLVV